MAPRAATLPEPVLRWAADRVAVGARVAAGKGLRAGGSPWWLGIRHGGETTEVVLRVGDPAYPERIATEAAALALAEDHKLPAPRLLGVDLRGVAGMSLLLMTALPGGSRIPTVASQERLHALGARAAAVHQVALAPRPGLPSRLRPIAGVDVAAAHADDSSPLLEVAEACLDELRAPSGPTVFVHGDLWQGNTLWRGGAWVGLVDWECAGVGHPGVDLGWLRYDAALLFGVAAADVVVAGWRDASGKAADAVAYWDVVVAARCTPADVAEWLPVFGRQGRSDLDAPTLRARRDAFLRQALETLDRS